MKGWWAVAVWAVGCAAPAREVRFAVGRLEPAGAAADRQEEAKAAARVADAVGAHAAELVDCFDELASRRDLARAVQVAVGVQLRDGIMTVTDVAPLDAATISDAGLVACLADRFARWPVTAADADLRIPLAVAPHPSPGLAAAERAAAEPPRYRAPE